MIRPLALLSTLVMLLAVLAAPASTAAVSRSPNWLSGASGPEASSGAFGTWRGSGVEIGQTWINSPEMYTIGPKIPGCDNCGEWNAFRGPISISLSPPVWRGWAAEARGTNDAYWRGIARKAKALRAGKGQVYLNPYYEFNGDWMPWSVDRTAQGMADFRAGYARTSRIFRAEFPGVKVVINAAAGRTVPAAMWPASSSFDVVGIDVYNEWPFCASATCVQSTLIARAEAIRVAAFNRGKPVAFPEWGNSANPGSGGGGGESPALMDAFHAYLVRNGGTTRGKVVYETYFNIAGYDGRYELFTSNRTNPAMPATVARYRAQF